MALLSKERVAQRITPGRIRWFSKEILRIDGPQPLAVVRKRRADGRTVAPIVLVHGFGQNHYAWHLPERSLVNYLAEAGFDVFNVDLRGHGRSAELGSERSRGVDDYIREDIPAVLDYVLQASGFAKAFLMGHSLGGICVAAAAARAPHKVAGVITVGPPHALGRGHLVLGGALKVANGAVGWTGLFKESQMRLPVDLVGKTVHAIRFAWDSQLAPIPVRAWKPGSFAGDELKNYLRSFDGASFGTVDELFKLAATGELRSRIDGQSYTRLIEESRVPLFAISGASDLLANPGSVKPLYERSRARDKRYVKVDAGHADLLVGRKAPQQVWPLMADWLVERIALAHQLEHPLAEVGGAARGQNTESGEYALPDVRDVG
jgi:pimeloyl-ACP methyl ester carboxylesterase